MDRIEKLTRLDEYGIFRDFTWPAILNSFNRFNLVYGWNGTGKTTLSRLLRSIQRRIPVGTGKAKLSVNGKELDGAKFDSEPLPPTFVFNRDFIWENVFAVGGKLDPIFVVGEENVEKQKEVDKLRPQIDQLSERLADQERVAKELNKAHESLGSEQAKAIKEALSSSPPTNYNNYQRPNYIEALDKLVKAGNVDEHRLDAGQLEADKQKHSGTALDLIKSVELSFPDLDALTTAVKEVLPKTVTSMAIEFLTKIPPVEKWVREGTEHHQKLKSTTCLYCDQKIPAGRLKHLEDHFNEEYDKFIIQLDDLKRLLEQQAETINEVELPVAALFYPHLRKRYSDAKTDLVAANELVSLHLRLLLDAIEQKLASPRVAFEFEASVPKIEAEVIDAINSIVAEHNTTSLAYAEEQRTSRRRIELHMLAEGASSFQQSQERVAQAQLRVQRLKSLVQGRQHQLEEAQRFIRNHLRPAEEFNKNLQAYLGHADIRLETVEGGYRLMRGSEAAEDLSEGERTAIALLYFLQSLTAEGIDLKESIVVLDDPVSSMDANSMYSAVAFVRSSLKGVGQLFILTHNFTFFREIRDWFAGKRKKDTADAVQPCQFYMIHSFHDGTVRSSEIRELDPLLRRYNSEYQYLFCALHAVSQDDDEVPLESFYSIPNMARRLLEAFLAFRSPHETDHGKRFDKLTYDEAAKAKLSRFLNAFSHYSRIGDPEHDLTLLAETPAVLKTLFKLIEDVDGPHYSEMMKLV